MYFVYQKQINVASKRNYDVNSIVEWFQEIINQDDIKENYGEDVTASDIVYDIFCESDWWYDGFIQHFELEEEVIDNMTIDDLANQIKEVAEDKLLDYYTKYLEELKLAK